jgi:hypothetical protein
MQTVQICCQNELKKESQTKEQDKSCNAAKVTFFALSQTVKILCPFLAKVTDV